MRWFEGEWNASRRPSVDADVAVELEAMGLLAVLEEAVVSAQVAESLLTSCDQGATLSPADARTGLHLRIMFAGLGRWLGELELGSENEDVRRETATLLSFYLHMVTQAIDARFSLRRGRRVAIRSRDCAVSACARLIGLRDLVRASLETDAL